MVKRLLLLPALALLVVAPTHAQRAPEGSNWQRIEALPVGTSVHVLTRSSGKTHKTLCSVKSVDADTLTCILDTGVGPKELVLQRSEIGTIKLARRGHSGLLGGLIAGGAGAAAGGIVATRNHYYAFGGAWAEIFGITGLCIGAPAGYLSDFTASTIYRAPDDTKKGGHGFK